VEGAEFAIVEGADFAIVEGADFAIVEGAGGFNPLERIQNHAAFRPGPSPFQAAKNSHDAQSANALYQGMTSVMPKKPTM
jgi:hypothetical protein